VKVGLADEHILPEYSESRQFLDSYKSKFNENELTPILLVITSQEGKILSKTSLSELYDFAQTLKANPSISKINSIVTSSDKLSKEAYYTLYKPSNRDKNASVKQLLDNTTRDHVTVLSLVTKYPANSSETKALIKQLKTMNPGKGLTLQITGVPVNNAEVLSKIAHLFPYALLWIIVLTYFVLLFLLRSLFLPLKAILMNIISLSASYGILVLIFQEGYLHEFLNFSPQGMLDISLLIIIFCALFGFSMDYEVFLLTRIKERYEQTGDNSESIIYGIDKSGRIITSAAIIVIFLCGSFMVADVLMVKEFGLGIAVAVFVDAFLVRSILVPSTMALLKAWNWYLPQWLNKILP
jgi:RND superfamily putative drug exporter